VKRSSVIKSTLRSEYAANLKDTRKPHAPGNRNPTRLWPQPPCALTLQTGRQERVDGRATDAATSVPFLKTSTSAGSPSSVLARVASTELCAAGSTQRQKINAHLKDHRRKHLPLSHWAHLHQRSHLRVRSLSKNRSTVTRPWKEVSRRGHREN
jgi:hypothetical protein